MVSVPQSSAVTFTDEEKELYETVFRNMSPMEFMKILRVGQWETLKPGATIIGKGTEVSEIRLVYHGKVLVEINDDKNVEVKDGAFLGEMAFVSGSKTVGEVSTLTKTRLLTWSFKELHRLFHRNLEIKSSFQSIISSDLASKLTHLSRR